MVEGRAGTGKSHLIKEIQKRLHILDIPYISLSPTNVACIGIDGITINRFINKVSKNIKKCDAKVVIVDEVGMVSEQFLKFFSTFKRLKHSVKFILCGNFEQLLPVADRVKNGKYKDSPVFFELTSGETRHLM